jgi:surface protein
MFSGCSELFAIINGDDWSGVAHADKMFTVCTKLKGGLGSPFNSSYDDATYARPDEGPTKPGYFTSPYMTKKVYTAYDGDTTLTYYCDGLYLVREGTIVEYDPIYQPNVNRFSGYIDKIKKVVIDASMQDNELTSGYKMFYELSKVTEIENLHNLNTSNMTDMRYMFYLCSKLTSLDLSEFNTVKVTDMSEMFNGCAGLTSLDISQFSTANVTDMSGMFRGCRALTSLDVSKFKTNKVTDMNRMFRECSALQSLDVSKFNTEKVESMYSMFYLCRALTSLDLSSFNTAKVKNMEEMFAGCVALTTIYCEENWSTSTVLNYSDNMFNACNALQGGIGTPYNSSYIDVTYAHPDGGTADPGYFSKKTATGMDNVQSDKVQSTKVLRDGQIYILRDGKTYNVMGVEVK